MTPIRFVCACEKGHLQDINWRWVVHGAGLAARQCGLRKKEPARIPPTPRLCAAAASVFLFKTCSRKGGSANALANVPGFLIAIRTAAIRI